MKVLFLAMGMDGYVKEQVDNLLKKKQQPKFRERNKTKQVP